MPGGKGPSQSGSVTQTTTNPTQEAQLPFLTGAAQANANQPGFNTPVGFNGALQLAETNPLQYYPGQTLANFDPGLTGGYSSLVGSMGPVGNTIQAPANAAFDNAVNGGVLGMSSPAFGGFQDLRSAGTNAQQALSQYAGNLSQLAPTAGSNPGTGTLSGLTGAPIYGYDTANANLANLFGAAQSPNAGESTLSALTGAPIYGFDTANAGLGSLLASAQSPSAGQNALSALSSAPIMGYDAANAGLLGTANAAGQPNAASDYLSALTNGAQISGEVSAFNNLGRSADLALNGNAGTGYLGSLSTGLPINGLGTGMGLVGSAGEQAGGTNTALDTLGKEATGAYLGANPYLNAEYTAATRPIVNAYESATAPQTDSQAELGGRYGSGALANSQSVNQQNLGKTLGDFGANLYGQDYANERGLMTSAQGTLGSLINQGLGLETQAGQALGNLGLSEAATRANAASNYGSLINQGIGLNETAAQAMGNLGLGEVAARSGAATNLGSLINQGLGLQQAGYTAAGNLGETAFGQRLTDAASLAAAENQQLGLGTNIASDIGSLGLNAFGQRVGTAAQLGSLENQQLGLGTNVASDIGSLGLNAFGQRVGTANDLASQYLAGIGAQTGAYQGAGQLENANLGGIEAGASGLQTGFDTGNRNSLIGLGLEPSVMQANYTPAEMAIQGGQGLTGISQAQLNDLQNRFYGNIQAPWQTQTQYANLIGNPQTGSSSTRSPVLGPNPLSSALGTLGSLGSLGNTFGLFGGGSAAGDLGSTADIGADFGGGGDALGVPDALGLAGAGAGAGDAAAAAPLALGLTVICTELRRQGRMPRTWYIAAGMADAQIPEIVRRGYHLWAIPSVKHMRHRPNSMWSRILERTFNWRAEDIAARRGIKGARRLLRGRLVTAVMALPCLALGIVAKTRDVGSELYRCTPQPS